MGAFHECELYLPSAYLTCDGAKQAAPLDFLVQMNPPNRICEEPLKGLS